MQSLTVATATTFHLGFYHIRVNVQNVIVCFIRCILMEENGIPKSIVYEFGNKTKK
jgi:hypothetical protein